MIRFGSKCWFLDSEVILNHFSRCLSLIAVIWFRLKHDIIPVPVKKLCRIWSMDHLNPQTTNITITTIQSWEYACRISHGGRDKMAGISQTTYSNAFSWMKIYEFRLKCHWILFQRIKLTISIIGSDNGLVPSRRQAIISTNDGEFTDVHASLRLNEICVLCWLQLCMPDALWMIDSCTFN